MNYHLYSCNFLSLRWLNAPWLHDWHFLECSLRLWIALCCICCSQLLLCCLNIFDSTFIFLSCCLHDLSDCLCCLDDAEERAHIGLARLVMQHRSEHKVFTGLLEVLKAITPRRVEKLGVLETHLIVFRLVEQYFFIAVNGLCVVLFAEVNISELTPALSILLVDLDPLVADGDGLLIHVHVPEQGNQSLDTLSIVHVLLNQVKQDGLCFINLSFCLIEDSEHPHDFD